MDNDREEEYLPPIKIDCWLATLSRHSASSLQTLRLCFNSLLDVRRIACYFPNLLNIFLSRCSIDVKPHFSHKFASLRSITLIDFACKDVNGLSRLISACPLLQTLKVSVNTEDEVRQCLRIVAPNLRWITLVHLKIEDIAIMAPLLEVVSIDCYVSGVDEGVEIYNGNGGSNDDDDEGDYNDEDDNDGDDNDEENYDDEDDNDVDDDEEEDYDDNDDDDTDGSENYGYDDSDDNYYGNDSEDTYDDFVEEEEEAKGKEEKGEEAKGEEEEKEVKEVKGKEEEEEEEEAQGEEDEIKKYGYSDSEDIYYDGSNDSEGTYDDFGDYGEDNNELDNDSNHDGGVSSNNDGDSDKYISIGHWNGNCNMNKVFQGIPSVRDLMLKEFALEV